MKIINLKDYYPRYTQDTFVEVPDELLAIFPVYKDGGDVCGFLWDKSTHVSTCPV